MNPEPMTIAIADIDINLQHHSLTTAYATERHIECVNRIINSLETVHNIVKPIVVSQQANGRYALIDGWARAEVASQLSETHIRALVYPPMDLEQRVKLRLALNTEAA